MFSKACKYGIRAVLFLALHAKEGQKYGAIQISDALGIPKHFLAKILQQLSKNGLISSTKGPSGGFYLSDEDLKKPLRAVVECIDGPDIFTSCILGLPVCSSASPCPLHTQAREFRDALLGLIEGHTIEQLATRIAEEEINI